MKKGEGYDLNFEQVYDYFRITQKIPKFDY